MLASRMVTLLSLFLRRGGRFGLPAVELVTTETASTQTEPLERLPPFV